jgi:hypothetical protein
MAITITAYGGGLTVGATETSLVAGAVGSGTATTTCILQGWLGLQNLVDGDAYELIIRRQLTSTATKGTALKETLAHAQGTANHHVLPAMTVGHAWDVLMRNAGTGTDKLIVYSLDTVT